MDGRQNLCPESGSWALSRGCSEQDLLAGKRGRNMSRNWNEKEVSYHITNRGDSTTLIKNYRRSNDGDKVERSSSGTTPDVEGRQPRIQPGVLKTREKPCIDVINTDMPQDCQEYAIDVMSRAVRRVRMFREMAEIIKKKMDKKFGSAWQCFVGRDFGFRISHICTCFLYVIIDGSAIIIYKND